MKRIIDESTIGGTKAGPRCPGCGKPMQTKGPHLHVKDTPDSLYYLCSYMCENHGCGWMAPLAKGKTAEETLQIAYDIAARRVEDDTAAYADTPSL